MKPNIGNLKVGDFVWIDNSDIFGKYLIRAEVLQILDEDFILLRYEYKDEDAFNIDAFNIIALAYLDNHIYPDIEEVRNLYTKLEKAYTNISNIEGKLSQIWCDFVGED